MYITCIPHTSRCWQTAKCVVYNVYRLYSTYLQVLADSQVFGVYRLYSIYFQVLVDSQVFSAYHLYSIYFQVLVDSQVFSAYHLYSIYFQVLADSVTEFLFWGDVCAPHYDARCWHYHCVVYKAEGTCICGSQQTSCFVTLGGGHVTTGMDNGVIIVANRLLYCKQVALLQTNYFVANKLLCYKQVTLL